VDHEEHQLAIDISYLDQLAKWKNLLQTHCDVAAISPSPFIFVVAELPVWQLPDFGKEYAAGSEYSPNSHGYLREYQVWLHLFLHSSYTILPLPIPLPFSFISLLLVFIL
jgi:hypothetical protein